MLCLLPSSFCENVVFRRHFQHEGIFRKTLVIYVNKLTLFVESIVRERVPYRFAIVFDGWAGGDTDYISVYGTFPSNSSCRYENILLACSPMEHEDTVNATEHYEILQFVLGIFNKTMDHVVTVIGDSCNMNRAMPRRIGPIFTGFHSDRYNLAVKEILSERHEIIGVVRMFMNRLSFQIPAGKLRPLTPLKPLRSNDTKSISTYKMLSRFMEIKE